jgi:hypothetical protein
MKIAADLNGAHPAVLSRPSRTARGASEHLDRDAKPSFDPEDHVRMNLARIINYCTTPGLRAQAIRVQRAVQIQHRSTFLHLEFGKKIPSVES